MARERDQTLAGKKAERAGNSSSGLRRTDNKRA